MAAGSIDPNPADPIKNPAKQVRPTLTAFMVLTCTSSPELYEQASHFIHGQARGSDWGSAAGGSGADSEPGGHLL